MGMPNLENSTPKTLVPYTLHDFGNGGGLGKTYTKIQYHKDILVSNSHPSQESYHVRSELCKGLLDNVPVAGLVLLCSGRLHRADKHLLYACSFLASRSTILFRFWSGLSLSLLKL